MSDNSKKPALLLAEYDSAGAVVAAAEKVRDAGYTVWDTHTPFPVHGMDAAMGLKDSKLGLLVFPIGAAGTTLAFLMMWWMNGVDYPLIIGGKPPTALPSMIPIMFELTVLLSAFGTVLGMFHLNRMPQHHHPIFNSERFAGFSNDKFFLSIESTDPKFNSERTQKLLESTSAAHIELVHDDDDLEGDLAGEESHA